MTAKIYLKLLIALIAISISAKTKAQHKHNETCGVVLEQTSEGKYQPLLGASVYWMGTSVGTTTDEHGHFDIETQKNHSLIISFIGYNSDTILPNDIHHDLKIVLTGNKTLNPVDVKGNIDGTIMSRLTPRQTEIITTEGLQRLACCNLSESFENTATVDVGYSDAVSGAKQIQMLGLAGIYTQMMFEMIPNMRGLGSSFGLNYIPGSWMQSIQVSKGTSSVTNGYESVTGQINVEYKKPQVSDPLFVNLYFNDEQKVEANVNSAIKLNDKWSTMFLTHYSENDKKFDHNHDGFIDLPLTRQINLMNRWYYENEAIEYHSIFGVNYINEDRNGGQLDFNKNEDLTSFDKYGIGIKTNRLNFFAKNGFGSHEKPYKSLGFILSGTYHDQKSFYGNNTYDGYQSMLYFNTIYQTIIGNTDNKISIGTSYIFDNYNENFNTLNLKRTENVVGVFAQYNYSIDEKLNLILGMRYDYNDFAGNIFTPRMNFKWDIIERLTLRTSLGLGYRSVNVIPENIGILASSRQISFLEDAKLEKGINYGVNIMKEILIDEDRKANISFDYYRTTFIDQYIMNLDASPNYAYFYNLKGQSYSNSFQVDLSLNPFKRLDITVAGRYNDVKVDYNNQLREKPFVSKYKGLTTLSYSSKHEWKLDFTLQYNGESRLPDTYSSPIEYRINEYSDPYFMIHAQITKKFKNLELYTGCENLTDFTQKNPIVNSENPFGPYFDSSMIWGPIMGRQFYFGLRYNLKTIKK
ncbi:MAG: hypothetical protein A2X12_07765 [Bacteroidetes bacterium GWE2_29_8]|nr:MAG: hypothetical protein A2X12_07765 [Bacteroidetes bacterium GWE2_29_8]OFY20365.1 MAG: hypothetical protein A2X02_08920 [Bacteroidetes bacterium GWF2_29_10]